MSFELLRELMNRGYSLYELPNGQTVLTKTATPVDPTDRPNELLAFETYEEALDHAAQLVGGHHETPKHLWEVTAMFNHALGRQMVELGQVESPSYEEACQCGEELAEAHLDAHDSENIDGWEVRVRPVAKK